MSDFDPTPAGGINQPPMTDAQAAAVDQVRAEESEQLGRKLANRRPPVEIEVGIQLLPADCEPGYATRHVVLPLDNAAQRAALKLLTASLQKQDWRLVSGSKICTPAHALLWLLEAIATELPAGLLEELMEGID